MKNEKIDCVLCGTTIKPNCFGWEYGHNPAPVSKKGRSCTNCNESKVMPARLNNA